MVGLVKCVSCLIWLPSCGFSPSDNSIHMNKTMRYRFMLQLWKYVCKFVWLVRSYIRNLDTEEIFLEHSLVNSIERFEFCATSSHHLS